MSTVIGFENEKRVTAKDAVKNLEFPVNLKSLVTVLLLDRPDWHFVAESFDTTVRKVEVFRDGESLGTFGYGWVGSSAKYWVENERVRADRESRRAYSTNDASKVIAAIKKYFNSPSTQDVIRAAMKEADTEIRRGENRKRSEVNVCNNDLDGHMLVYVRDGEGFKHFQEYTRVHEPAQFAKIQELETLQNEHAKVSAIKTKHEAGETIVVVQQENSHYLVHQDKKNSKFTDDTLPEHIKMSLGLLKLVETKQFVSDIGFRSADNVFILLDKRD